MKIHRYWVQEKVTVKIGRQDQEIRCWGGSSFSMAEARTDALEKAEWVQKKIKGRAAGNREYEAAIREEILNELSPDAIVTRNRYGARVLNVKDTMFLDIDHAPFSFFKMFSKRDVKKEATERIEKLSADPKYAGLGFRIYETSKGIRAIVTGAAFEAKSKEAQRMMNEFGCDKLYTLLCRKQNCFRARLTPKPYRIKLKSIKFSYPYDDALVAAQNEWLSGYESASKGHSACRFVKYAGKQSVESPIVKYHDEATEAFKNQVLA